MSLIMAFEGFNTPRAILDYAFAQTNEGKTIVVLRAKTSSDNYSFIATTDDSDIRCLQERGYHIVETFSPDAHPCYDHEIADSDSLCC